MAQSFDVIRTPNSENRTPEKETLEDSFFSTPKFASTPKSNYSLRPRKQPDSTPKSARTRNSKIKMDILNGNNINSSASYENRSRPKGTDHPDTPSPIKEINQSFDSCLIDSKAKKRTASENQTPLRRDVSGGADSLKPKRSDKRRVPDLEPNFSESNSEFNFAGLPDDVRRTYVEKRKINELYEWQKDCLSDIRLLRGVNCIVCLPTGAGKTIVAEVLMLREAIVNKRSSILVLPYVAIVQEKITSLNVFEESFKIRIEEYAASKGRLPPISRRSGASIYVCTIEKANMLINSLIEAERIDTIGMIVVDELHMLGDGQRGAIIEQLLTKYMYKGNGQVVGMSATLSNMDQLQKFLNAFVYSTDFRPITLSEQVKIGQAIYKVESGRLIHKEDLPTNKIPRDPDGVCELLKNVLPRHQVIIFCPTKKNCENLALMIASVLPKDFREHRSTERKQLVCSLAEDEEQIDDNMRKLLMAGIAFHHSGLTHDERKHIESAYKEGVLFVLCATSTLAAGVNLPARRVIIKSPMVGRNPLGKAQYLQMVGRAGRAGFDEIGESFTIVRRGVEEKTFREMLSGPMISCNSELVNEKELTMFILDIVALKLACNKGALLNILKRTLLCAQKGEEEMNMLCEKAVSILKMKRMLVDEEEKDPDLVTTALGEATFIANMNPTETPRISSDLLENLNNGMVFSSHFHLLLLISPYDISCQIDWNLLHNEHTVLPKAEKELLHRIGLPETKIVQAILRGSQMAPGTLEMRLYLAMILQRVWRQESHTDICRRFNLERGWLQSTLQNAISQASAIARFAGRLEHLWPLTLLLPELVKRLQDCQQKELIPLLALDCVKKSRANELFQLGYKTVGQIAKANASDLVERIERLNKHQATRIVQSARALIRDEIDTKMEEIGVMGIDSNEVAKRIMG